MGILGHFYPFLHILKCQTNLILSLHIKESQWDPSPAARLLIRYSQLKKTTILSQLPKKNVQGVLYHSAEAMSNAKIGEISDDFWFSKSGSLKNLWHTP